MSTICNNPDNVIKNNDDLTIKVKNQVASDVLSTICSQVFRLENIQNFVENLTKNIAEDFRNKSYMTVNLELTQAQKDELRDNLVNLATLTQEQYLIDLKTDQRTKDTIKIIQDNLTDLVDEVLSSIAKEINRGCIISGTVVSADTKNSSYNKLELNYPKKGYDVTLPTQGVFLSTNCIQEIKNALKEAPELPSESESESDSESEQTTTPASSQITNDNDSGSSSCN